MFGIQADFKKSCDQLLYFNTFITQSRFPIQKLRKVTVSELSWQSKLMHAIGNIILQVTH